MNRQKLFPFWREARRASPHPAETDNTCPQHPRASPPDPGCRRSLCPGLAAARPPPAALRGPSPLTGPPAPLPAAPARGGGLPPHSAARPARSGGPGCRRIPPARLRAAAAPPRPRSAPAAAAARPCRRRLHLLPGPRAGPSPAAGKGMKVKAAAGTARFGCGKTQRRTRPPEGGRDGGRNRGRAGQLRPPLPAPPLPSFPSSGVFQADSRVGACVRVFVLLRLGLLTVNIFVGH